jgi:hypothetical protein
MIISLGPHLRLFWNQAEKICRHLELVSNPIMISNPEIRVLRAIEEIKTSGLF